MKTFTQKEFEKLYGQEGLSKLNQGITQAKPGFIQSIKDTATAPSTSLPNYIDQQGSFKQTAQGSTGIKGLIDTTFSGTPLLPATQNDVGPNGTPAVVGKTLVNAVSDFPSVAKGFVEGIIHPIDAVKGIANYYTGIASETFKAIRDAVATGDLTRIKDDISKAEVAMIDHPLQSILAFEGAMGIPKIPGAIKSGAIAVSESASRFGDSLRTSLSEIKKPDVMTKSVEQLRADKIKSGYEEQNTRLKSADNSFKKNTKTYKTEDGNKTTVTPIDTFMKYNIAPTVEKGTINMGDYQTGQGALGKIKEQVSALDSEVDTHLQDGAGVPLEEFKAKTIKQIESDATLKQSGKVASTISKIGAIFDDYKNSYGDIIMETEINAIRKVMNQDWHPDTVDVSHIIGDTARKIIYDVTPDQTVRNLLRQQGELLSAKKYAQAIHGTKVTGGRLGNMAMRTGGAILGTTLHNLPIIGPLIGMIGGEYLSRGLQQTQFKSIPAEARALLQRSKSKTPTTKAKTIPSTAISTSKPRTKVKSSKTVDK